MSIRGLPVRPNLDQLRHQAKELHRALRAGDAVARAEWAEYGPRGDPAAAKLADAQHLLARLYQATSWPRVVQACALSEALWDDDLATVQRLVRAHPSLLHEHVLIRKNSNWGPPLSYAANLGRDRIIRWLYEMGATDGLAHALDRALLQGQTDTARLLYGLMGSPGVPEGSLDGPAYTLNLSGTQLALELGARVITADGRRLAPVDVVLETDSRKPSVKHAILALYEQHGLVYPDTPPMALHRGRLDLLEAHLARDPALLTRTFTHEEIYPPSMGCHDEVQATHATPLAGTTLLHMCADYGEIEIARWLLDRGMPVNTRATIDDEGFGGHTALFSAVVSQTNFWRNYQRRPEDVQDDAAFTRLLLDHGADPHVRVSLRKQLHPGYGDDTLYVYRDVTPLSWGEQFSNPLFVSRAAMRLIAARS